MIRYVCVVDQQLYSNQFIIYYSCFSSLCTLGVNVGKRGNTPTYLHVVVVRMWRWGGKTS